MPKRLPPLSLLAIAPIILGCRLDESDRADFSFISVGRGVGRCAPAVAHRTKGPAGPMSHEIVPGHAMPGGGTFQRLAGQCATADNDIGQHAFVAVISEGGATLRAAYRRDA